MPETQSLYKPKLWIGFQNPVNRSESPKDVGARLFETMAANLERAPEMRKRRLTWHVNGEIVPKGRSKNLVVALRWLWDGMRILPYTDEQIACAAGQCVALWHAGAEGSDYEAMRRATTGCFGEPIKVEFGSSDGAYAKAFISDQSVIPSVRSDIRDYLDPAQGELLSTSATGLLMAVMDPSRLFEFSALVNLFARELVPCQVLYRQDSGVTYFSPLRLRRFGLA